MRKNDERRFFSITLVIIVIGLCLMGLSKYYNRDNNGISGPLLPKEDELTTQQEPPKQSFEDLVFP